MTKASTKITAAAAQSKAPLSNAPVRKPPVRQAITIEAVAAITPSVAKAEIMSSTFGLEPVDFHGIRERTEEHLVRTANELTDNLNPRAMAIWMQRIVGAFVSAAHGAAVFYGLKKSDALGLNHKLLNDHRDEDRDGVSGFESKAARAAAFAAEIGLQAHTLLAAAEGAVHAYAHITGDEWKPYEGNAPANTTTERKSTDAMIAALSD